MSERNYVSGLAETRTYICIPFQYDTTSFFFFRSTSGGGSTPCALCSTVRACSKNRASPFSLRSALVTMAINWTPPASHCPPPLSSALLCLMVWKCYSNKTQKYLIVFFLFLSLSLIFLTAQVINNCECWLHRFHCNIFNYVRVIPKVITIIICLGLTSNQ